MQVFSCCFFFSLHEEDSQIFLLYTEVECLPTKNSALARIRQKRAERNERDAVATSNNKRDVAAAGNNKRDTVPASNSD